MYYSDEIVEQVLHSTDIVDVVSAYVHLQKKGANYFGLCPFHNEKTGSFSVSAPKQIFYCFGCGAGGNALTFLMKYENCSFGEAMEKLAERAGIVLPKENRSEEYRKQDRKRQRLLEVNKEAAVYYYRILRSKKGERGLKYLRDRELSPQTINAFGLGFADGASSDLTKHLKQKGFSDEEILEAGVAAFDEKRGLHDKFWNRVIFPIQDINGKVIGFGGRVMGDGKPKYLNSPETVIFNKSRNLYGMNLARRSRKPYFILCEGYMDVIAMHQAGFTQACASLGTSFTDGQAAIIKRYVKQVYLAYDSDEAGVRAALRNLKILQRAEIQGRIINMNPYKDPDEFMKALGPEEFQKRIDGAENSFMFELRMLEKEYSLSDPAGRTDFYHEIARKLCEFDDAIERDNYLKASAAKYFINEENLRTLVASYNRAGIRNADSAENDRRRIRRVENVQTAAAGAAGNSGDARQSTASARSESLPAMRNERLLLTWLTDDPAIYPQIKEFISPEDFEPGMHRKAAELLWKKLEESPDSGALVGALIISGFETEEEQQASAFLFSTRLEGITTVSERERAFTDIVTAVKRESLKRISETNQDGTGSDPGALMRLIQNRKMLDRLSRLKIKLRESE